jgi:molecular chaperone HscB
LEKLESRLRHEMRELEMQLAVKIDDSRDYAAASEDVRKLKFLEKLEGEIASAFDEIDI